MLTFPNRACWSTTTVLLRLLFTSCPGSASIRLDPVFSIKTGRSNTIREYGNECYENSQHFPGESSLVFPQSDEREEGLWAIWNIGDSQCLENIAHSWMPISSLDHSPELQNHISSCSLKKSPWISNERLSQS